MADAAFSRLKHAWNAFLNRDPTYSYVGGGTGYSYRPDRVRLTRGNERSIVTSVFNRIALDVAAIDIKHCILDKNGRFVQFTYNLNRDPNVMRFKNMQHKLNEKVFINLPPARVDAFEKF